MAGLLIETRLAEFLRSELSKTTVWGQWDCGLRIADWLVVRMGVPDPAAHLRGRYVDRQTFEAVAGAPYPVVIGRLVRAAGLRRVVTPGPGDVGVIRTPDGTALGAIRTARGWSVPARVGLIRVPADAPVMMAWGVV